MKRRRSKSERKSEKKMRKQRKKSKNKEKNREREKQTGEDDKARKREAKGVKKVEVK